MTVQSQDEKVEVKNDKEHNFRLLEAKYERQLAQERAAREAAEKVAEQIKNQYTRQSEEDDEYDSEPYVDKKKLDKKLFSFEKKMEEKINAKAEEKARHLINENREKDWLSRNDDFYTVLQNAQALAEADPELAETILQMPDSFERQKLVYRAIKSMGLHQPKKEEPSVQQKIDANRRSPYYQPSGVATAPYATSGDFSSLGQKQAYEKMQELKARLRI